jgi:diguanylate cyclase (GGDEF)-like protein/PAS domain S-box-containing protein
LTIPVNDAPLFPVTDATVNLASVLDCVDIGVIVLDAGMRVVRWNGWMEKLSGISGDAAAARDLVGIFPELLGGRLLSAANTCLNQGLPSILSPSLNKSPLPLFSQVVPGGTRQRIQQKIRVLPLRNAGAVSHCLIEVQDVSLGAHREKVIGEQKKFLNTILDSEPECVLVQAFDGTLIQMNPAGFNMLEIAGITEAKAAGFVSFIIPEQRAAFDHLCHTVLAGEPGVLEFQICGCKGTRRWLETHATPLRDAQGQVTALLCVARDITARKQAEATTRALIDSNQESAMLLDPTGKVLAVNEIGARRLNLRADDLVGRVFYSLLPPDLARTRSERIGQVFHSGQPLNFQDIRDGIHFDVNAYPVFDGAGGVGAVSVYAADVTERLQLQAVDRLFHDIDEQVLRGLARQTLFEFVCCEVTRIFGYPFAWIGRKQNGGAVSVLAFGGDAVAYLDTLQTIGVRWDNSALGQGAAGTAIRTGRVQTFSTDDAGFAPWRVAAAEFGLKSQLSIPQILRGEVYGSFTVSSRHDAGFSNPVTTQRLSDVASRICVAIERAFDQEQLLLLETALSSAANGVFIADRVGRIQWLNSAFETLTGRSREESLGSIPQLMDAGRNDTGLFRQMLDSIATGQPWRGESVECHKDGSARNIRQSITPITDSNGKATHFISILEDVTATREAEASILRLAHYDYLTGLPNRALFHDRLRHEMARAHRSKKPMALLFLDLDHFKTVNDTHGHDIGDRLLKGVAQRLSGCLRGADSIARLAGDEFTIILAEVSTPGEVGIVCKKIVAAIDEPFDFDGLTLQTGVSIGAAFYPDDAQDEAALLKCADQAMYAAKADGRSGFRRFTPALGNP